MPLNLPRLKSGKLAPPPLIIRKPRRPGWALLTAWSALLFSRRVRWPTPGRARSCGNAPARCTPRPGSGAARAKRTAAAVRHHSGTASRGCLQEAGKKGKQAWAWSCKGVLRHGCTGPKAVGVQNPRQAGEPSVTQHGTARCYMSARSMTQQAGRAGRRSRQQPHRSAPPATPPGPRRGTLP